MNLESGQRYSTEELKEINAKRQMLQRNTAQQNSGTQTVPTEQIPEQTQTPIPQPIVIQCGVPEGMVQLEQRLRTLEQISSTQVNLLQMLAQNTTNKPTWQQTDTLLKQMDKLLKQIAHLEKMAEQAGKPKEKHSWLRKLRMPRITLPEVDWPVVILVLMMLAALVMIWLFLGKNLSGWMSLLR